MEDGPIREEKGIFEKIRDSILGNRKKKIFITTYSPYTKKEQNHLIRYYKDQEYLEKNIQNLGIAAAKAGMTFNEFRDGLSNLN